MLVLPALLALPALSVKFTALADRFSVSDSVRLAFRAIVCAPELSCADAIETAKVIASTTTAIRKNFPVFIFPPRFVFRHRLTAVREGPVNSPELVTEAIIRGILGEANGTQVTTHFPNG